MINHVIRFRLKPVIERHYLVEILFFFFFFYQPSSNLFYYWQESTSPSSLNSRQVSQYQQPTFTAGFNTLNVLCFSHRKIKDKDKHEKKATNQITVNPSQNPLLSDGEQWRE